MNQLPQVKQNNSITQSEKIKNNKKLKLRKKEKERENNIDFREQVRQTPRNFFFKNKS